MDTLSLTKEARIYNGESEVKLLSRVQLFVTPWTVAYQASLSMGFSRQKCWGGLPFPSPGDLPNPGIEPGSPTLQAAALPSEPPGKYFPLLLFISHTFSHLTNMRFLKDDFNSKTNSNKVNKGTWHSSRHFFSSNSPFLVSSLLPRL